MLNLPVLGLAPVYDLLTDFAHLDNFWGLFEKAFGTQYDHSVAEGLRSQWLAGDFGQSPKVEVVSGKVLGTANRAYASSTNKIDLSDRFVATASPQALGAVLFGHFVDAQVNQVDTAGDEGEKFSALVRGYNLTSQELERINIENDWTTLTIEGNTITVEQAAPIILTVNTTADQNDGSAANGLSLRDAILIANANPDTEYEIHLTRGVTYTLTSNGINENAASTAWRKYPYHHRASRLSQTKCPRDGMVG